MSSSDRAAMNNRRTGDTRLRWRSSRRAVAWLMAGTLTLCGAMPALATPDNVAARAFPTGGDAMRIERIDGDTRIVAASTDKVLIDHVLKAVPAGDYILVYTGNEQSASPGNARQGLLSKNGRVVLEPLYADIDIGDDGTAFAVRKNDKYAVFAPSGKRLTPFAYDRLNGFGSTATLWTATRDDKQGVIDPQSGRVVVPMAYESAVIWRGRIFAYTGYRAEPDTRVTVFDAQGDVAAGLKDVQDLHLWHDAALVVVGQRVIDPISGKTIVAAGRFDSIEPFDASSEKADISTIDQPQPDRALAIVSKDGKYGAIGATGAIRVPIQYTRLYGLDARKADYLRAIADTQDSEHNVGVVDRDGRKIVATDWDGIDLREVAEWEGDPSRWFFFVRRDDRFGILALDGGTILKPVYDEATAMARRGELYRVTRDGKSGVCSVLTGRCPLEVAYDSISVFDGTRGHATIYRAARNDQYTLVDEDGRTLIAPAESIRKIETGLSTEPGLKLMVTRADGVHGVTLAFDEDSGHWQRREADLNATKLLDSGAYDGHGTAQLTRPTIVERYLPEQYANAAAVVKGVDNGKLRSLSSPSLQISADGRAYVFFSQFSDMSVPAPNTLPVCPTTDGFDIVLGSAQGAPPCQQPSRGEALHFKRGDDGQTLRCANCRSMGIPARWVLRNKHVDTPARCALDKPWSKARAKQQYADWHKRWSHDIDALKKAHDDKPDVEEVERIIGESVDMSSRAPYNLFDTLAAERGNGADTITTGALEQAFADAEPVGYGGIYPETSDRFADKCQQVWYMRLPKLEDAVAKANAHPAGLSYLLPDTGELKRHAYPFLLFTVDDGTLRWAGLSAEFVQALHSQSGAEQAEGHRSPNTPSQDPSDAAQERESGHEQDTGS